MALLCKEVVICPLLPSAVTPRGGTLSCSVERRRTCQPHSHQQASKSWLNAVTCNCLTLRLSGVPQRLHRNRMLGAQLSLRPV
jgi:hypothetical protein